MQFLRTVSALGLCSFMLSSHAYAWGDLGHSIVGEIAEETISDQARDFTRGLLGIEPLAVAATWPDHVRDDQRFGHTDWNPDTHYADNHDFADYHFRDIPIGSTYFNRPNKELKDAYGAIQASISMLKENAGGHTREEKLIALRYLIHLMGDVTQPLHVGNGRDRGANSCQIRWQSAGAAQTESMNLHAFWDDTLVNYLGTIFDPGKKKVAHYYREYVPMMKARHQDLFTKNAKQKYGSGTLADWLIEAVQTREGGVYPDDAGAMRGIDPSEAYKHRPYCLWYADAQQGQLGAGSVVDASRIPTIGVEYADRFAPVVEIQLIKAGLRLAATLDGVAAAAAQASVPPHLVNNQMQELILKLVQDAFRSATNSPLLTN